MHARQRRKHFRPGRRRTGQVSFPFPWIWFPTRLRCFSRLLSWLQGADRPWIFEPALDRMDNVSHSLSGPCALARWTESPYAPRYVFAAPLPPISRTLTLSALAKGQLAYLEAHRGMTHSLLAVPILAFACVFLVSPLFAASACLGSRRGWFASLDWLATYCSIGQMTTASVCYRLFRRNGSISISIHSRTDLIFAAFAVAAVWPWLSGLVSGEIGDAKKSTGKGVAIAMLLLMPRIRCGPFHSA